MSAPSWAVKYRAKSLKSFIGNPEVVAQVIGFRKGFPSFFLLSGPTGTGKTTLARILATEMGCHDPREINVGSERGIDSMRDLVAWMQFKPMESECKVAILDEAHALTAQAAPALLKSLEEPPAHARYIFATDQPQKLLPTIRGRAIALRLVTPPTDDLLALGRKVLKREGAELSDSIMSKIVDAAGGQPRLFLGILQATVAGIDGGLKPSRALAAACETAIGISASALQALAGLLKGDSNALIAALQTEDGMGLIAQWQPALKWALAHSQDLAPFNPYFGSKLPKADTATLLNIIGACSQARRDIMGGADPWCAMIDAFCER